MCFFLFKRRRSQAGWKLMLVFCSYLISATKELVINLVYFSAKVFYLKNLEILSLFFTLFPNQSSSEFEASKP
jgi:hypothetical protein